MQHKKILIIEPEAALRERIARALIQEGAVVCQAASGEDGLRSLYAFQPDLVLLEMSLPVMDGWETCERIRRLTDIPIILLSAIDGEEHILRGFQLGADYFLSKPLSVPLLQSRVRAALRLSERRPEPGPDIVSCSSRLTIDFARRMVFVDGERVHLSGTEYRLLVFLARYANRVVTTQQILASVWGWEQQEGNEQNVYIYISRLRRKIEEDPRRPVHLLTEYGVGYQLHCDAMALPGEVL